ncbi:MAG: hypothetical protein WDW36_008060 [Sanguina aurantia]
MLPAVRGPRCGARQRHAATLMPAAVWWRHCTHRSWGSFSQHSGHATGGDRRELTGQHSLNAVNNGDSRVWCRAEAPVVS